MFIFSCRSISVETKRSDGTELSIGVSIVDVNGVVCYLDLVGLLIEAVECMVAIDVLKKLANQHKWKKNSIGTDLVVDVHVHGDAEALVVGAVARFHEDVLLLVAKVFDAPREVLPTDIFSTDLQLRKQGL